MMDVISRAHRQARVTCRRLYVDFFKRGRIEDFSVSHAIKRHTAGKAHRLRMCSLVQAPQHREEDFFEPSLQRGSEIAMPLLDWLPRVSRRPQQPAHRI